MEKRRGTWLAHGMSSRFITKALQPDESLMRNLVLNLMAFVGLIFFALILLHLVYGLQSSYAFHVYVVIFLVLEGTVIFVWLYIYLRRRSPRFSLLADAESARTYGEQNTAEATQDAKPNITSKSHDKEEDRKIRPQRILV